MAIEYFWQDEAGMLDEFPALPRDEQLRVTDKQTKAQGLIQHMHKS